MSYSIVIEDDHIYVKYSGIVDGLDIVRITADETFINSLRRLQKVIHDFSFCDEVSLGFEDMQEIAFMSNMESNFTEKAVGVLIPRTPEGLIRIAAFTQSIKSVDWTILAALNYAEALTKI
tara:strand:+ start:354 stop:716 length:363 start_codon:yes stop_codon:yes gene_type:complete